jgi:hypothetical protein
MRRKTYLSLFLRERAGVREATQDWVFPIAAWTLSQSKPAFAFSLTPTLSRREREQAAHSWT